MITSRKSFNREIKNLLDIAENKTKVLCKVYDSSLSEQQQVSSSCNNLAEKPPSSHHHHHHHHPRFDFNKLGGVGNGGGGGGARDRPKDYKKIIDMNYSNLRKKQSNVLNKVKLWDQLLESGSLNINSWGRNFFEFS
jgi:hypothetical protein